MNCSFIGFKIFCIMVWLFNFAILNVGLVIAVQERRLIRVIFIFLGILVAAAMIVFLCAQIGACK